MITTNNQVKDVKVNLRCNRCSRRSTIELGKTTHLSFRDIIDKLSSRKCLSCNNGPVDIVDIRFSQCKDEEIVNI